MKYRKKPLVIEAWQWPGEPRFAYEQGAPEWIASVEKVYGTFQLGQVCVVQESDGKGYLAIKTLEGEMTANPGDWIIRGAMGVPEAPAIARASAP